MDTPSSEGVVRVVDDLIERAIAARASDLHFEPLDDGMRVRFRVDGLLHDVETLPAAVVPNVIARLKVISGLLTYRTDTPQEGAVIDGPARFGCDIRVAAFPTIRGERVVLRFLGRGRQFLRLRELGHDPAIIERVENHLSQTQGLILVCGPAGSGKTTALYAMLDFLLRQREGVSVMSVEDPVEIRLEGVTQVQIQPARGLTYAAALRSLLRQDPQVLMVGEIRDAEVAEMIIEAALTGHLLLTTMHSGTPAEAIIRLRDMGIPAYQITSTLQCIWSLRLVRKLLQRTDHDEPHDTPPGSAGRTAIGHLVDMTPELSEAIRGGADKAALSSPEVCPGSLRQDAERLLRAGITTEAEIRRCIGA
jgi:general secretion pathway protein E